MQKELHIGSPAIILFRFHRDFEVCHERIRLLRHLNPRLAIHAIYGGPKKNAGAARRLLGESVESIWDYRDAPERWKWLHPDLAIKEWYLRHGHRINFSRIFDHEWDLLCLASMEDLYPRSMDASTLAFSGLELWTDIEGFWGWTSQPSCVPAVQRYMKHMKERYGMTRQKHASLGPAPSYPREFIERFAAEPHPRKIFDPIISEITLPGFAQALGFNFADTRFHPGWSKIGPFLRARRVFNCEDISIQPKILFKELQNQNGRRIFHPVKYHVPFLQIRRTIQELPG